MARPPFCQAAPPIYKPIQPTSQQTRLLSYQQTIELSYQLMDQPNHLSQTLAQKLESSYDPSEWKIRAGRTISNDLKAMPKIQYQTSFNFSFILKFGLI